jgi:hypothetical protein
MAFCRALNRLPMSALRLRRRKEGVASVGRWCKPKSTDAGFSFAEPAVSHRKFNEW